MPQSKVQMCRVTQSRIFTRAPSQNTHTGHSGLTKYNGMFRARGVVIVIVLTLGLVGNAGAQRRWRSIVDDRHDR